MTLISNTLINDNFNLINNDKECIENLFRNENIGLNILINNWYSILNAIDVKTEKGSKLINDNWVIIWNMVDSCAILDDFKQTKEYTFEFFKENWLQMLNCDTSFLIYNDLSVNHDEKILNKNIVNFIMDILLSDYIISEDINPNNIIFELIGYYKMIN